MFNLWLKYKKIQPTFGLHLFEIIHFMGNNMPNSYNLNSEYFNRFGNIGTITRSIVGCLKKGR
jgi:hypothetical protein